MKTLFLTSGIPGSGKSTWCKARLANAEPGTAVWHSRDAIRFSMLQDGEDYFMHEDEVIELWIKAIQTSIDNPFIKEIYVDATHLNDRSRAKTLSHLELTPDVKVVNAVFDLPLQVCLQHNAQRTGREFVPESVIRRMYNSFRMPNNGYETIMVKE